MKKVELEEMLEELSELNQENFAAVLRAWDERKELQSKVNKQEIIIIILTAISLVLLLALAIVVL